MFMTSLLRFPANNYALILFSDEMQIVPLLLLAAIPALEVATLAIASPPPASCVCLCPARTTSAHGACVLRTCIRRRV